ncbi:citrate-binding protein-like [Rhodamnia argentea]|uniref:Citrate-binding protein-like n=1 Tax=Rhodamnia argentea TaxID=178133 RepID=A0A8B8PKV5_9MYRT|nr:citrate-binding protein-like [Rhodamnia argentea]
MSPFFFSNAKYTSTIIHLLILAHRSLASGPVDPTQGFVSLPLNRSNYNIQKPYDVPEDQRYSFSDGVHKCWVYSTDKPHTRTSLTKPRTEIAIHGYNYSSGVWQFEGYGYVPAGTSGVCVMQVFGASPHATTFMLRVYNGSLMYYRSQVLVDEIYNKWFRLNVIHDVDGSKVKVCIDGYLKLEADGREGTSHAFKCGVYAQDDDSFYMESRWRGIKVLRKNR